MDKDLIEKDLKLIDELCNEMENVPFGNSQFQIKHFVALKETPERTYRQCLLELNQKVAALYEAKFSRKRLEIDILEIEENLLESKKYETMRLEIDLEQKKQQLRGQVKLLNDCIIEVDTFLQVLGGIKKFSRQEFELAEAGYWQQRIANDALLETRSTGTIQVGTLKTLNSIGIDVQNEPNGPGLRFYKIGLPEQTCPNVDKLVDKTEEKLE